MLVTALCLALGSGNGWDLQDNYHFGKIPLESDRCNIEKLNIHARLKHVVDELQKDSGEHSEAAMEMYNAATGTLQQQATQAVELSKQAQFRDYLNTFSKAEETEAEETAAEVGWPLRKKILMAKISLQDKPVILVGILDAQQLNEVWTKQRFETEFGPALVADYSSPEKKVESMSKFVTSMKAGREACSFTGKGCPKVFITNIPKEIAPFQQHLLEIAKQIGSLRYRVLNMSMTDVTSEGIGTLPPADKFALAGFMPQMFIGSAYANTYPHKHEMAIQMNLVGKKRWFVDTRKHEKWDLCYQADAERENALDFLANRYDKWIESDEDKAQECTLEAAEIIVVPDSACHAIISLSDSVALAYEVFGNNFYWGSAPAGYWKNRGRDEF